MKCIVCGDDNLVGGGTIYGIVYCQHHVNITTEVVNHVLGNRLRDEITELFSNFPKWDSEWKHGSQEYFEADEKATQELIRSLTVKVNQNE